MLSPVRTLLALRGTLAHWQDGEQYVKGMPLSKLEGRGNRAERYNDSAIKLFVC